MKTRFCRICNRILPKYSDDLCIDCRRRIVVDPVSYINKLVPKEGKKKIGRPTIYRKIKAGMLSGEIGIIDNKKGERKYGYGPSDNIFYFPKPGEYYCIQCGAKLSGKTKTGLCLACYRKQIR